MALRHEYLTPDELALQADLDRSWVGAQTALADPEFRAELEVSIERVLTSPPAPRLTREEFLAQTELPSEQWRFAGSAITTSGSPESRRAGPR